MRDRLLEIALLSFPRRLRERDGAVLLDLARDMVDAGAPATAEAAGIAVAGLQARLGARTGRVPWRAALEALALPLASAVLALYAVGVTINVTGPLGKWWALTVTAAAVALAGTALRRRGVAVAGWTLLLLATLFAAVKRELTPNSWHFITTVDVHSVDVQAAILPLLAVGLASSLALEPGGRRRLGPAAAAAAVAAGLAATESHAVLVALLLALFGGPVAFAAYAAIRRRPVALVASALLLAAAAPQLVWSSLVYIPYPGDASAYVALVASGAGMGLVVLRLLRRAAAA
jgi:hypothetical protein